MVEARHPDTGRVQHLTLVTPLAADRDEFFRPCAASVASASVPRGWTVSWRVQVDGVSSEATARRTTQTLSGLGLRDSVVRCHGFQAGAARTRSLALFAESAPPEGWLLTLDADDVLLPDTLRLVAAEIDARPHARWIAGGILRPSGADSVHEVLDAHPWSGPAPVGLPEVPDDGWTHLPPLVPAGPVQPRALLDHMDLTGRFPVFAACVALHAATVWHAGGWPGTPTGEDAALLGWVSDRHPGVLLAAPLTAYRQHAGQNTRAGWHSANREITWRMIHASRPPDRFGDTG